MRNLLMAIVLVGVACEPLAGQEQLLPGDRIRESIKRSLPLLEAAAAITAQQRKCFTCHGQALPAVVLDRASQAGLKINGDNLQRQLDHTYAHLERSRERYLDGRGTGGQVDTAGWALWGLESDQRPPDENTDAVVAYLLNRQHEDGSWRCSSNRPPSEQSDFATTYLALRGLHSYGQAAHADKIASAVKRARSWVQQTSPVDTEDRVFQLLSLPWVDLEDSSDEFCSQLKKLQRDDGGWGQTPDRDSDAYATATALHALNAAGIRTTSPIVQRGLRFLLDRQLTDGSWHVKSRSKPFQTYFETGYPHDKDQFISMTAACWATLALLDALADQDQPSKSADHERHTAGSYEDDFLSPQQAGRLAERGDWKFADGVATCTADPALYKKYKNHGPILKWPREFQDATITFEMKATDCQRVVFTLNGEGHIFRVTLADERAQAPAGPSKVPTRIIAWATRSSKQNKGDTITPPDMPDLPAVNGQWVPVRLSVRGKHAVLRIGEFQTELTHAALARDKNMVMITFAHGELAVRNFRM